VDTIIPKLEVWIALYGLKILAAFIILVVGRWICLFVRRIIRRLLNKADLDQTIVSFVSSLAYYALLAFVLVAALSQLGIQTTSFIAVLGAAGLAIALALRGSLANFASGLLLVLFQPFEAGDYIEGAGTAGTVEEIHIFSTRLVTPDNKVVTVPNGKLMGDNIVNFSAKETRRVDFLFGVGYDDDLQKVRETLLDIVEADERVLKEPNPMIAVSELADNSVNLTVRIWTKTPDYWGVRFDTIEAAKKRFDSEGISIPFPQRDIHVYEKN
jgi:small conductance mechanosensitive channel